MKQWNFPRKELLEITPDLVVNRGYAANRVAESMVYTRYCGVDHSPHYCSPGCGQVNESDCGFMVLQKPLPVTRVNGGEIVCLPPGLVVVLCDDDDVVLETSDGEQFKVISKWCDVPVGSVCTLIYHGKETRVRRIEDQGWFGNGYYNARRVDKNRSGRVFIYPSRDVWDVSIKEL